MPYDRCAPLWPSREEAFFRDRRLVPRRQQGPHCVSTTLAVLTGEAPGRFQAAVNTQDPVSWSDALRPFGMKLAYCPTDVRKLRFYLDELVAIDDLFLLCFYSPVGPAILADPDASGWVCASHVVTLHRDRILDTKSGAACEAREHDCIGRHTKRIFRVVPADHPRGL
jgi:hypothetical protein